ncbi:MAG: Clp1/GlmU family protein [Armatimonadota bacterium]
MLMLTAGKGRWDIPGAWRPALDAAVQGATMLLLGETDSGKSTAAMVLANQALAGGRRVGIVDADVGQSSIGPPACVSLALPQTEFESAESLAPDQLDFVGACSPAAHLLQAVSSTAALVAAAREARCETIIVDTTGMVAGGLARALKAAKIRLTDPDIVVALQADGEVEHLIAPYRTRRRPQLLRLRPSRAAQSRSREERTANRQRRFAAYFAGGASAELSWQEAPAENSPWTNGEQLPGHLRAYAEERLGCEVVYAEKGADTAVLIVRGRPDPEALRSLRGTFERTPHLIQADWLEGLLVGLLGATGETLAMGRLEGVDFRRQRLAVYTPLTDPGLVRGFRLGSVRISRDGSQLGAAD